MRFSKQLNCIICIQTDVKEHNAHLVKQKTMQFRDSKCELTWHDPLADQLLSSASLLKFELEDCMDPEMTRREKRREEERRRESVTAGERRKPQRWSSERGQQSIRQIHTNKCGRTELRRTCTLR